MDKIKIRNLEIFAHHGVFPEENVLGQKFIINATLYTDLRNAGKTDELTASIHYGEICLQMEHFLTTHTFKLLERAAESLAETLLMNVSHLEKIKLEIKKPWAPIGLSLETVSVEIERSWHTAYIALGSNIGNKEQFLGQARILKERPSLQCIRRLFFSHYEALWGHRPGRFPERLSEASYPSVSAGTAGCASRH